MPNAQITNEPTDPTVLDLSDLGGEPAPGDERVVIDEDDQQPGEAPHLDEGPGEADSGAVEASERREAESMGWAPKEKWRGDPANWVDHSTFLRRGKIVLPIVQQENKRLKSEIARIQADNAEFRTYMQAQLAARAQFADAQLKADRLAALEANDLPRLNEIDIQLAEKRAAPKPVDKTAQFKTQEAVRIMNEFMADGNDWMKEPANQRRVTMIGNELRAAGETATNREFLDIVKDEMVNRYPHLFRQTNGRGSPIEMGGSPGGSSNGSGRTYANLKPEFKAQADKFAKNGDLPVADYVKNCEADAFRK